MPYKCTITCDGETVEEEEFDTRDEAEDWGTEWLNDFSTGAEVLDLSGEDYIDPDDYDYEVTRV